MARVGMISHSRGSGGWRDETVEETGGKESVSREWNFLWNYLVQCKMTVALLRMLRWEQLGCSVHVLQA